MFAGQRIHDEDYKRITNDNLLQLLKYKLYSLSDRSISFDEFDNALSRIAEVTTLLKAFKTKKEAVDFFMKQKDCSLDECSSAYDFYVNLFEIDKVER